MFHIILEIKIAKDYLNYFIVTNSSFEVGMRFILMLLIFNIFAYCVCTCECVNGHVQSICENAYDVHLVCPPRVCPIVPPSVQPINPPSVTPPGFSACYQKQVYNDSIRQYEWRKVCE